MAKKHAIPVLIEAPQGSRSKLSFDFQLGLLRLTKVLPAGFAFPFNFGSIPCTRAEDGDPLDILLFMTESVPAGTLVAARLIGVLKAEQQEGGGEPERNDRVIGVAVDSTEHRGIRSVGAMEPRLRQQIESFFEAYNAQAGKKFRPLGWVGPAKARKILLTARRRYRAPKVARPPYASADYAKAANSD